MNMRPILNAVAAAGLVAIAGAPGPVWADDAEIYVNTRDLPESSQPMVMFSLDYRPSLGNTVCQKGECDFLVKAGVLPEGRSSFTQLEMMRGALRLVMEPLSGVQVGLMMSHRNGPDVVAGPEGARQAGSANGGYIAMGFRELKEGDANGTKAIFDSVLATLPVAPPSGGGGGGGNQGTSDHAYQGRELFYEFYRYLAGGDVYNGKNGFTSFDAAVPGSLGNINVVPEFEGRWLDTPSQEVNGFAWDPTIIEGAVIEDAATGAHSFPGRYISPLSGIGDCGSIYTVNLLFGVSQQESDSDDDIRADIGVGEDTGVMKEFAPMIEYLNRTDLSPAAGDQSVVSYFLGPDPQYRQPRFARLAEAGGSGVALHFSEDPEELVATLTDIFKQILSVSTTFTAAALPVNSFDRSQVLSDVFLGLFQPQAKRYPGNNSYWWGNVKKLKLAGLGEQDEAIRLVDANDNPAVAADGRIRYIAQTLWTDPLGADVLDAGRDPDENAVAGYDGRSVNRGGSGQKTPGFPRYPTYSPLRTNPAGSPQKEGPRRMLYDRSPGGPGSLAALEATPALAGDELLQSAIGTVGDATETLRALRFMRGLNPVADDPDVVPMQWMFGSVIHSRPLPVNYGARAGHGPGNPLIYIAAGGNDGALRFIRNTDSNGAQLGQEAWAFVPTEVMGNTRRMNRELGPEFSGGPDFSEDSTIYGFDGPPTLYTEDLNSDGTIDYTAGDKAILYAGLRRGGRAYYALDVSNPESPELLWRIVAGETAGFERLGWTFSPPRVGKMNISGTVTPVVIFGGGFDRAYDNHAAEVSNPLGRGIYVVHAKTGDLIRHIQLAGMQDSIPSSVSALDTTGDGFTDRLYVGDLGGRVWRVDMVAGSDFGTWTASLLADLGRRAGGAAAGGPNDRRFFHAPDVVQSSMLVETGVATAETVKFHAVLIGSGDRENPKHNTPNNWFFMIRDTNFGVLTSASDTAYEMADLEDVTSFTGSENDVVPTNSKGWRLSLATVGEKSLASSLTVANTVYFTTYIPAGASPSDLCGPVEGSGRLYAVSLRDAAPRFSRDEPVGDGTYEASERWLDLRAGGIPAEAQFIGSGSGTDGIVLVGVEGFPQSEPSRWRTFWYLEEDPVQ